MRQRKLVWFHGTWTVCIGMRVLRAVPDNARIWHIGRLGRSKGEYISNCITIYNVRASRRPTVVTMRAESASRPSFYSAKTIALCVFATVFFLLFLNRDNVGKIAPECCEHDIDMHVVYTAAARLQSQTRKLSCVQMCALVLAIDALHSFLLEEIINSITAPRSLCRWTAKQLKQLIIYSVVKYCF